MAKKGDKWVVVKDGRESKTYDGVSVPVFSEDSQHHAFTAMKDNLWFAVVDDTEGPEKVAGFLRGSKLVFETNTRVNGIALQPKPAGKEIIVNIIKLVTDIVN
jgi:hypothetical protein